MTNPETCRHDVISAGLGDNLKLIAICLSCETDVSDPEMRINKRYLYDERYEVWVHKPWNARRGRLVGT